MIFLSPRNDLVFKKLFGTPANRELLISFLNSVLDRPEGKRIATVEFNDPSNHLETVQQKFSIVDVRCTDENGHKYIIEMQNPDYHNFIERAQYYGACGLSGQLLVAENYKRLLPVIFVGVVDYSLFPDSKDFISPYGLLNKKTYKQDLNLNEYYFIELPKFTKKEDELKSLIDKWVFFLKEADKESEVPAALKSTNPFPAAYHVLTQSAWTPNELELYKKQIDAKRNEIGALEGAQMEGEQKGLARGREEGLQEGEQKALLATARAMLAKGIDVAIVADVTGLPVDAIKKLTSEKIK
jgi:predicted transposase/invertase (TIGR01784 family)